MGEVFQSEEMVKVNRRETARYKQEGTGIYIIGAGCKVLVRKWPEMRLEKSARTRPWKTSDAVINTSEQGMYINRDPGS